MPIKLGMMLSNTQAPQFHLEENWRNYSSIEDKYVNKRTVLKIKKVCKYFEHSWRPLPQFPSTRRPSRGGGGIVNSWFLVCEDPWAVEVSTSVENECLVLVPLNREATVGCGLSQDVPAIQLSCHRVLPPPPPPLVLCGNYDISRPLYLASTTFVTRFGGSSSSNTTD